MKTRSWNDESLCRIMHACAIVDADPQTDKALYDYQQRVVDFNLNAERLVGEIAEAGAEVFYTHAKSHTGHVWFDTAIGHKVQALGNRDLLAEITRECRRRGMATVGMFQICLDRYSSLKHPEWRQINSDGQSFGSRVCFNNPEYRRYILDLIAEAVGKYKLDGVMVDEFDFSGRHGGGIMCYCPHCQALFETRHNTSIPATPDWQSPLWRSFVRFRLDALSEMMRDIRQAVKTAHADALLTIVSYSGIGLPWQRVQPIESFCESIDYFSLDAGGAIDTPCYARLFRAYSTAKAELIGGMQPPLTWVSGTGALPIVSRVARLNDAMSTIANNLTWNVDINYKPLPVDRALDAAVTANYADIAREIQKRADWVKGRQESLADIGLFYSENSKIFYGGDEPPLYTEEFMGCFKVLLENGMVFDLTGTRHLHAGDWRRYKVVVMPAAACLSDADAEAVRDYVAGGGVIVATFNTSLHEAEGARRANFALTDVLGVDWKAEGPAGDYRLKTKIQEIKSASAYGFMRMPPDGTLSAGLDETCGLLTPVIITHDHANAVRVGDFMTRHRTADRSVQHVPEFDACNCNMGEYGQDFLPPSSLAVTNAFGQGRAVYLAAKFGSLYHTTGFTYAKTILTNAVLWAYDGRARIKVKAPACVEVTAFKDDKERIIIHLVNYQSAPLRCAMDELLRPGILRPDEILPVHDIRVEYRPDPGKLIVRARQIPEMLEIPIDNLAGGGIGCVIPKLDAHTMLVLEE